MRGIVGKLPLARREHLIIEELVDETLVYDLERDRAHCLNQSAALAWKYADGKTGLGEMAKQIERDLGTPITNQSVRYALDRLGKAHLLDVRTTPLPAGLTRRKLMKRAGRAAAAISVPLVVSIVAPTAAQAQSTITPGNCDAPYNGVCCTNHKTCRLFRGNWDCNGAPC
jgi:hypothetical protein